MAETQRSKPPSSASLRRSDYVDLGETNHRDREAETQPTHPASTPVPKPFSRNKKRAFSYPLISEDSEICAPSRRHSALESKQRSKKSPNNSQRPKTSSSAVGAFRSLIQPRPSILPVYDSGPSSQGKTSSLASQESSEATPLLHESPSAGLFSSEAEMNEFGSVEGQMQSETEPKRIRRQRSMLDTLSIGSLKEFYSARIVDMLKNQSSPSSEEPVERLKAELEQLDQGKIEELKRRDRIMDEELKRLGF